MSNPKISVLITCHNTGRFLRAAVDSALAQDHTSLEVIVVDDGSTDDTPAIIQEYGEKIIGIRQENKGCAGGRNTALKAATGDIIVILDADDILLPQAVSFKVKLLQSQPNVGLVTSVAGYIDEKGEPVPGAVDLKPPYPNGVSYLDAMHRIPGPISGWAIPRKVFEEVGPFDESLRASEDWDLCLRILSKYKCLCDPEIRMLYREVPGSLSRDYSQTYDQVRLVIKKHRKLTPIGPVSYWWNSRIMLLTSCAGVFTRILTESGPHGRKRLWAFLKKRPSTIPYFFAWAARAVWNRILYLFKRGPLRKKELALKSRSAG